MLPVEKQQDIRIRVRGQHNGPRLMPLSVDEVIYAMTPSPLVDRCLLATDHLNLEVFRADVQPGARLAQRLEEPHRIVYPSNECASERDLELGGVRRSLLDR